MAAEPEDMDGFNNEEVAINILYMSKCHFMWAKKMIESGIMPAQIQPHGKVVLWLPMERTFCNKVDVFFILKMKSPGSLTYLNIV